MVTVYSLAISDASASHFVLVAHVVEMPQLQDVTLGLVIIIIVTLVMGTSDELTCPPGYLVRGQSLYSLDRTFDFSLKSFWSCVICVADVAFADSLEVCRDVMLIEDLRLDANLG